MQLFANVGSRRDLFQPRLAAVVLTVALLHSSTPAAASQPKDESQPAAVRSGETAFPPDIVEIAVEPPVVILSGPQDRVQLLVTGRNGRGDLFDLTHLVRLVSRSEEIATVSAKGVVLAHHGGTTALIGQVGDRRLEIPVRVAERSDSDPVSFQHEVVPILTRSGCNSGACHGTPTGKNGFRLSLRGYDPSLDIDSLTREVHARRINHLRPGESLILLKAIAAIPHEGGRRIRPGDELYKLLRDWIRQGGRDDVSSVSALSRLEIFPRRRILEAPARSQQLRVVAHFVNGSIRDVTHLTRFSVNDPETADAEPDGRVEKRSRGEVTVSAEYLNEMVTANLLFLEPMPEFVWRNPPAQNYVDRHVFTKLKLLRIEPSELSVDDEFLRRVFLDTTGTLPTLEEARSFLADTHPEKRARLIDSLLDKPEFADWWAMKWTDRLGCNQRFVGKIGAIKYHRWISGAMAVNMPEDRFVREILTAGGPNYSIPPASFWRRLRKGGLGANLDPRLAAEEISQLFLGVRIQCARCHNHPGERWTQDDYYGLAAFFTRVKFRVGPFFNGRYDKEDTVFVVDSGEIQHPRTGGTVSPNFLGSQSAKIDADQDRRVPLARWLTSPENPFFARAAVNRIWNHLFGRGIVEPVDDFRSSNPPSHEELLDALSEDFIRHGFDRKQMIRTILNSRTYQLSSKTTPTNLDDTKYFSHARVRLLQAEPLMDAICRATGTAEKFPGFPLDTTAVELPDGEYKHPFLEAFGRPARAMACECERDPNTNLVQALHLVSGRFVHEKIRSDTGRAARLAASQLATDRIVEELFLATLSRFPGEAERQLLSRKLEASRRERRKTVEDLLWTLLNHDEFLFQH